MASEALFKLSAGVRLKAWKFTSLPIRKLSFAKPSRAGGFGKRDLNALFE